MTDRTSSLIAVAIVDEEMGRLALLIQIVEQAGFIAMPAHGGHKARRLFSLVRPEVAVVHANLESEVTASNLCAEINGPLKGDGSNVPIIVIAHEEQAWFSSGEQELVSDYLILPFPAYQLIQRIRQLLNLRDVVPEDEMKSTDPVS